MSIFNDNINKIVQGDCLEFMKGLGNNELDIIYCDPPYALGSEVIIRSDGKPDYSKAADFMSKWDCPPGDWWEAWFKECFRILKYSGWLIMFAMPRQDFLFKYYSVLSGFKINEPLWWYFIQGFPKSTNLEKQILKSCEKELETKYGFKDIEWE